MCDFYCNFWIWSVTFTLNVWNMKSMQRLSLLLFFFVILTKSHTMIDITMLHFLNDWWCLTGLISSQCRKMKASCKRVQSWIWQRANPSSYWWKAFMMHCNSSVTTSIKKSRIFAQCRSGHKRLHLSAEEEYIEASSSKKCIWTHRWICISPILLGLHSTKDCSAHAC